MVVMIVRPLKGHPAIVNVNQPMIGNRDPVGVAAQIVEYLVGSPKGRLGVDHPFCRAERSEIRREPLRVSEGSKSREELEALLRKRVLE
jgi:hypothetical protein